MNQNLKRLNKLIYHDFIKFSIKLAKASSNFLLGPYSNLKITSKLVMLTF